MAVLEILQYPNPELRKKALEITKFDGETEDLAQDLAETMYYKEGVGLAASQVGIARRIFVMDCFWREERVPTKNIQIIINPIIKKQEGSVNSTEGCLSIPEVQEKIKRSARIQVNYQNVKGERVEKNLEDIEAVCFQHEIDHLNGILFIDRLSPLKRRIIFSRLKKACQK